MQLDLHRIGCFEGKKQLKASFKRLFIQNYFYYQIQKPLQHKRIIERELEGFGIRLNKDPPQITLRRKDKGGINLQTLTSQSELDLETVKTIFAEYKIANADVVLKYDATADDLIDVIEGNRIYTPCIYILNKIDQISIEELEIIYKVPHCVPISAHHKWNYDDLLMTTWDYLKLIRMYVLDQIYRIFDSSFAICSYTKPKGQLPDYESPVILTGTTPTVEDFCNKLHKSIMKEFKQ